MTWPIQLAINAWTGDGPVISNVGPEAAAWVLRMKPPEVKFELKPEDPDQRDWRNPKVGWGLLLPGRDDLTDEQLASASDAPEPIQALLESRKKILRERGGDVPIFRFRPGSPNDITHLRNYGSQLDKAIHGGTERGSAPTALPKYLLIYGTPQEIPWELQYILNTTCYVGRLDLRGAALENYITALLHDWADSASQLDHAVVWAVDHGSGDITTLMRNAIAQKVYAALNEDEQLRGKVLFLDGSANKASSDALIHALAERNPSLVVTTSHGQTNPLSDPVAMRHGLGLLIDQDYGTLQPEQLLERWQPDGATWYAHACCSAGSDNFTNYDRLIDSDSHMSQVLRAVAGFGSLTASFPEALLGAAKPLRAFIGHVEPTFDWTIRDRKTGEHLTASLRQALYNGLFLSKPVGLAFAEYYQPLSTLYTQRDIAERRFGKGEDTLGNSFHNWSVMRHPACQRFRRYGRYLSMALGRSEELSEIQENWGLERICEPFAD